MKSAISIPVISFLTLTSTVSAAPQATPSASSTGLSDQQMDALRSYAKAQETKSAYISVSRIVKTAVPAATLAKEQADFRLAALTTDAPKLPAYLGNINDKASAYLQDYYLAQASIINNNGANKAVESDDGANLLAGITGTAEPAATNTASNNSSKPSSTVDKPSSSKNAEPKATSTKGQDPASQLNSTTTASQTTEKPNSTGTRDSDSTGTGTASSGTSTGAAAISQPTGVMKIAGVGILGIAGFAAFL